MLNRQVEGSSERKVKTSKPRRPKKGGHGDLSNMMDALLAEREIRDKSSSRVAVDNALRTLYREDEPAWHCLQAFYVRAGEGLARRPTVAEEFAMHRGLQRLLGLLKDDPLRLPREMEIEALLDDNVSVNEIARCLGIHRGRVQKVKRKLAA